MEISLSEDFVSLLGLLSANEIKKATKTVLSIKSENTNSGLRPHPIEHPSKHIVSYSVNMDIRILAYQKADSIVLLYVGHHDEAYRWIRKRSFIQNSSGDFRIITSNEEEMPSVPQIFDNTQRYKNKAKKYSIDKQIIKELRKINNEEELLLFIESQPKELQDSLLDLAADLYKTKACHVSSKSSIRVVNDDKILEGALLYPFDRWRIFLHPTQELAIKKPIEETSFITGAPGTGKTVCLVHKAKLFGDLIGDGECILVATFKECLQKYIQSMLVALNYNSHKVFVIDISSINTISDNSYTQSLMKLIDGFLYRDSKSQLLFYYKKQKRLLVKHLLIDEYQDYTKDRYNSIKELVGKCPMTISYDYCQCIYKNISRTIDNINVDNVPIMELSYSYRVNDFILKRLKVIMSIISVLASSNIIDGGLTEEEARLVSKTESAIIGEDISMIEYTSEEELEEIIQDEYEKLLKTYLQNQIIITSFTDKLIANIQENRTFNQETIPHSVRNSYAYLPTLKGQEFNAGIIILDGSICHTLNINRLILRRTDKIYMAALSQSRRYYNLLYVALSRFRDHVTVLYPQQYREIVLPLFSEY